LRKESDLLGPIFCRRPEARRGVRKQVAGWLYCRKGPGAGAQTCQPGGHRNGKISRTVQNGETGRGKKSGLYRSKSPGHHKSVGGESGLTPTGGQEDDLGRIGRRNADIFQKPFKEDEKTLPEEDDNNSGQKK